MKRKNSSRSSGSSKKCRNSSIEKLPKSNAFGKSEVEEGNTNSTSSIKDIVKQVSPAKYWCFTLNNYTEEHISSISSIIKERCSKGGFGKEIAPTTGMHHLQGFISFHEKARPAGVFGIKEIHWTLCKGNLQQNVNYISKDGICFNHGLPKPIKIISELYPWQQKIVDIVEADVDDRTVHWIYDKEGCKGKTALCKYLTVKHKAICLGGKPADVRNGIVEYQKTHEGITPPLILLNIPRSINSEYLSYEALENIKDMYFYSGKYEGGQVCGNAPHLFIFSNDLPDLSKMTSDRWKIHDIKKEEINLMMSKIRSQTDYEIMELMMIGEW